MSSFNDKGLLAKSRKCKNQDLHIILPGMALPVLVWAFCFCLIQGSSIAPVLAFRAPASVVIAHTNDTHSHLEAFKRRRATEDEGGIARRATLLNQLRKCWPNFIYADAGDMIQGTLFFKFFHGEAEFRAAGACGLDIMAIGNHEFDAGQDVLARLLTESPFKAVSANVHFNQGARQELSTLVQPWRILERGGYRIAMVGLTTSELLTTTMATKLTGISVEEPVKALERVLPELQGKCDAIVLLSHLGLEEDLAIAQRFPQLTAIIGGHTHTLVDGGLLFRTDSGTTLVVQDGFWGSNLGVLRISLSEGPQGVKAFVEDAGVLDVNPEVASDPAVEKLVSDYSARFGSMVKVAVGRIDTFLDGERSRIRVEETNLGNLIADVMREFAGTDIAFQNAGGIRSSIKGPVVTVEDVLNTMPFGNELVTVKLTGEELNRLFDAVARAPRDGQFGGFLQVSGMKVVYEGSGVKSLEINGKPLDPAREYTAATNDFLILGGDGLTVLKNNPWLRRTGFVISDLIMDHFRRNQVVNSSEEGRIVFMEAGE